MSKAPTSQIVVRAIAALSNLTQELCVLLYAPYTPANRPETRRARGKSHAVPARRTRIGRKRSQGDGLLQRVVSAARYDVVCKDGGVWCVVCDG